MAATDGTTAAHPHGSQFIVKIQMWDYFKSFAVQHTSQYNLTFTNQV